ncbi:MAG: hypothetical protein BJ554DRAFT_5278, partial [Olpidium bornovanus]
MASAITCLPLPLRDPPGIDGVDGTEGDDAPTHALERSEVRPGDRELWQVPVSPNVPESVANWGDYDIMGTSRGRPGNGPGPARGRPAAGQEDVPWAIEALETRCSVPPEQKTREQQRSGDTDNPIHDGPRAG